MSSRRLIMTRLMPLVFVVLILGNLRKLFFWRGGCYDDSLHHTGRENDDSLHRTGRENGVWSIRSLADGDRSGAIILLMLKAHAYSYANGLKYKGHCFDSSQSVYKSLEKCLKGLSVSSFLNLSCPPGYEFTMGSDHPSIIDLQEYQRYDLLTPQWLAHIRYERFKNRLAPSISNSAASARSSFRIAVHLRRGDVNPCRNSTKNRYFPNQFYLDLIERYTPKNISLPLKVTIFSESRTHEPFDDFVDRGYNMALGTDLGDTWNEMATADILILGESTFSLIPAIFSEGLVVYPRTPRIHRDFSQYMPHFVNVDFSANETEDLALITDRLADQYCKAKP
eukprot:scaffold15914_cov80-Cylindrotheca_fusiformis.AAC.5